MQPVCLGGKEGEKDLVDVSSSYALGLGSQASFSEPISSIRVAKASFVITVETTLRSSYLSDLCTK